jgi:hypothetical protein
MHVHHLHLTQLLQHRSRSQTRRHPLQPYLQTHLQAIRQEADESMRLDPLGVPVSDRPDAQGLPSGSGTPPPPHQPHVLVPQLPGILPDQVRPQQIAALLSALASQSLPVQAVSDREGSRCIGLRIHRHQHMTVVLLRLLLGAAPMALSRLSRVLGWRPGVARSFNRFRRRRKRRRRMALSLATRSRFRAST